MEKTGKLIVIDGTDGSGKATQTKLLVERLQKDGQRVQTLSFPQYGQKSAALVEEYLAGRYGSAEQVGPQAASIFYAVDRFAARGQIKDWLNQGQWVVTDRFVSSNMGHQGGKIHDTEKRKEFFQWEDELEHGIFNLPRPDKIIFLHVAAAIGQQLTAQRDAIQDIHQQDLNHLKDAEAAYQQMAEILPNFERIECVQDGNLLPIEQIHERVFALVKPLIT
ncbi:thymidylate kinase [Patescibacteria group bacterium]|nr:thymidylate kinase [Patescibacteria group bacterium]MBU1705595.1 thymidylate kinase [Patescibacteria group bacterium]